MASFSNSSDAWALMMERARSVSAWLRRNPDVIAIAVLVLVNIGFFLPFYLGDRSPPWDFLGGYHGQAVAIFEDGNLFVPPSFLPYGSLGFPSAIAVQSSAYYPPLGLLDLLSIDYDIGIAARVQALHVLLGGLGAYSLARVLKFAPVPALAAGLSYQLMGGFFSSQQHVDIVRGYAWIPVVLLFATPRVVRSRWGPVGLPLVLVAFFTGSYLGLFLPTAIAALAIVVTCWPEADEQWAYARRLALGTGIAIAIAQIKFLPPLLYGDVVDRGTGGIRFSLASFEHLVTVLVPPDRVLYRNDLTMQGLFVPALALAAALFVGNRRRLRLTLCSVALGMFALGSAMIPDELRAAIPGFGLTRFPLAEWRPIIALASALLAAVGVEAILRGEISRTGAVWRGTAGSTVFIAVAGLAIWHGTPLVTALGLLSILLLVVAGLSVMAIPDSMSRVRVVPVALLVVVGSVVSAATYHSANTDMWLGGSVEEFEVSQLQLDISDELSGPRVESWERRPARIAASHDVAFDRPKAVEYRRAWYLQEFATLGADNLKRVVPFNELIAAAEADATTVLWGFLTDASSALLFPAESIPTTDEILECLDAVGQGFSSGCGEGLRGELEMTEFRRDGASYGATAPQGMLIVENEVWYPGWEATLCGSDGCIVIDAEAVGPGLRGWEIPEGHWLMEAHYRTPGLRAARMLALVGLAAWAAMATWLFTRRKAGVRRARQEQKPDIEVAPPRI